MPLLLLFGWEDGPFKLSVSTGVEDSELAAVELLVSGATGVSVVKLTDKTGFSLAAAASAGSDLHARVLLATTTLLLVPFALLPLLLLLLLIMIDLICCFYCQVRLAGQ